MWRILEKQCTKMRNTIRNSMSSLCLSICWIIWCSEHHAEMSKWLRLHIVLMWTYFYFCVVKIRFRIFEQMQFNCHSFWLAAAHIRQIPHSIRPINQNHYVNWSPHTIHVRTHTAAPAVYVCVSEFENWAVLTSKFWRDNCCDYEKSHSK